MNSKILENLKKFMNFKKKLDWINFMNLKIVHALEKVHGFAKVFMHFKKYQ
jgi:hypothetical protein